MFANRRVCKYFYVVKTTKPLTFNETHMEELGSIQKFIEIRGWLLLTFSIGLLNQLRSFNSIIVQMPEKYDSSSRQ